MTYHKTLLRKVSLFLTGSHFIVHALFKIEAFDMQALYVLRFELLEETHAFPALEDEVGEAVLDKGLETFWG